MSEKGIHIDIFREKTIDEFSRLIADPSQKTDTGSAAAAVSAIAAAFLCRATKLIGAENSNVERFEWLKRNSEILRNYFVKLIDEDVKCKGPLRRAEKEDDQNKISAARQTAISICTEIINMNGKCLEVAEELSGYHDETASPYILESVKLVLASTELCISYCLKMSRLSSDDTYRYVIRRENELNLQSMHKTADRIHEMLSCGK